METTWIEVGSLTIRAPIAAGTNLCLAVQCVAYRCALRRWGDERGCLWADFFLAMAVATFAGVFKHGARHLLDDQALSAVLWISNVGGGLAVYFAQRASLVGVGHAADRWVGLRRLAALQLSIFMAGNVALGPEMTLLIVHTALGLLPVLAFEGARARGTPGAGWISSGLGLSLLTGLVYGIELSAGRWLNHIDIAHLLMGAAFAALHHGARSPRKPGWR